MLAALISVQVSTRLYAKYLLSKGIFTVNNYAFIRL